MLWQGLDTQGRCRQCSSCRRCCRGRCRATLGMATDRLLLCCLPWRLLVLVLGPLRRPLRRSLLLCGRPCFRTVCPVLPHTSRLP